MNQSRPSTVPLLLAVVIALFFAFVAIRALDTEPQRVCFPASKWGPVEQRYRPCARIERVFEDGSVTLGVYDADGTQRYTTGIGALDR